MRPGSKNPSTKPPAAVKLSLPIDSVPIHGIFVGLFIGMSLLSIVVDQSQDAVLISRYVCV